MTQTMQKPGRRTTTRAPASPSPQDSAAVLANQLKELCLPTIRSQFQEAAVRAATENLSHLAYLAEHPESGYTEQTRIELSRLGEYL